MSQTETKNELINPVNLSRLPMKNTSFFKLNQSSDWVKSLLDELNEFCEDPSLIEKTSLNIDLELVKKFDDKMGEILIVKGSFSALFSTKCVSSCEDMYDDIMGSFQAIYLEPNFQKDPAYQDLIEIYYDSQMYELYFQTKGSVDLKEMIHEQIYLEVNQYPTKK